MDKEIATQYIIKHQ